MKMLAISGGAHTKPDVLTAQQLRGARGMLGWSRDQLAKESRTSAVAIENFERGITNPRLDTVQAWIHALHKAGVVLLDEDDGHGPGVRLRKGVKVEAPTKPERVKPAEGRTTGRGRKA